MPAKTLYTRKDSSCAFFFLEQRGFLKLYYVDNVKMINASLRCCPETSPPAPEQRPLTLSRVHFSSSPPLRPPRHLFQMCSFLRVKLHLARGRGCPRRSAAAKFLKQKWFPLLYWSLFNQSRHTCGWSGWWFCFLNLWKQREPRLPVWTSRSVSEKTCPLHRLKGASSAPGGKATK